MATNRADTLDPALLRPGRLDRKIEFPLPDRRQKRLVFSTITGLMNLSEEVDLEDCILTPNKHFHSLIYLLLQCCIKMLELFLGIKKQKLKVRMLFIGSWIWFLIVVLNKNADVARPDKISGADINSICQEVSLVFLYCQKSLSHTINFFYPVFFMYRLECLLCVKTVILCWQKILRRLTRPLLRRMSRNTSSTNRAIVD